MTLRLCILMVKLFCARTEGPTLTEFAREEASDKVRSLFSAWLHLPPFLDWCICALSPRKIKIVWHCFHPELLPFEKRVSFSMRFYVWRQLSSAALKLFTKRMVEPLQAPPPPPPHPLTLEIVCASQSMLKKYFCNVPLYCGGMG